LEQGFRKSNSKVVSAKVDFRWANSLRFCAHLRSVPFNCGCTDFGLSAAYNAFTESMPSDFNVIAIFLSAVL
jgi:hypothetical protein